MSENLNRDFSKYETMETEELEEILRLDAETPEGVESDTESILYILEVLASRRNNENITGNTAQKAWESFQQNYMPEKPLESLEVKRPASWLRRLVAAAAVVALMVFIPISTSALTLQDVLDIFARWAKETFSFVSSENAEVDDPLSEDYRTFSALQEMLMEDNRDASIVPSLIPEGFELEKIEKAISPMQEIYLARYTNGDRVLRIRIQNHLNSDFQKIEVSQDYSEIYSAGKLDYFIFINFDQTQAVWIVDSYECTISGNLSVDEIKIMIDSIGKG